MQKILKFLITEFLFNGHLQSIGSAGIVYIVGFLAKQSPPDFWIILLTYLTFEMVFIFDRYRGLVKDEKGNKERTQHLKSYFGKIPFVLAVMFVTWLVLLAKLSDLPSILSMITFLVFGLLYPLFFKGITKKIFMFKNFYVAGVYFLLAFFPLIYYQVNITTTILLLALMALVENILSQAILDTKDIQSDKADKLKTFSVVFGFDQTQKFVIYSSLVFGLVAFLIASLANSLRIIYLLILVNFIINIGVYLWFGNKLKPKVAPYLLSAGKCFVWFCVSLSYVLILR